MLLVSQALPPSFPPPMVEGDPAHAEGLGEALRAAFAATSSQGAWPPGPWGIRLHADGAAFERATGAPPDRAAQWMGGTLHLRPWDQLRRRGPVQVLRHELTHRRLLAAGLRRWVEEARCLWAETHVRPQASWPGEPAPGLQARLDRALAGGTTREQAWAYRWLRAWLRREPLPLPPWKQPPAEETWIRETALPEEAVTVVWPPERLRGPLAVNGQPLSHQSGRSWLFRGRVSFGAGFPVRNLEGLVRIEAEPSGWRLFWTAPRAAWIGSATEGELGAEAPFEARRALAALLGRWLERDGDRHPGGALCPLTHCAVVRGAASETTARAVASAPSLDLEPRWAFFTGSAGGQALSPRAVWGEGPSEAGCCSGVPRDRWRTWERTFSPAQVAALKRDLRPGLKPGQAGLRLGASGPYPVEAARLAAGRRFGWTAWPSNACEAEVRPDGSLRLRGRGWGHNAGLCLATARFRAEGGASAEQILAEAFPASWRMP